MSIVKNLTENFISDIKAHDSSSDIIVSVCNEDDFLIHTFCSDSLMQLIAARILGMSKMSEERFDSWVAMAKDVQKMSNKDFQKAVSAVKLFVDLKGE